MELVLVQGLLVGAVASDHGPVGAPHEPVGADALDAFLDGGLCLFPRIFPDGAHLDS